VGCATEGLPRRRPSPGHWPRRAPFQLILAAHLRER